MFEPERIEKLAEILRQTNEAHSVAFASTDGANADWPGWFAERLEAPLNEILGTTLDRSEIATLLDEADQEHLITSPGREWPPYYAEFFIARVM